METNTGSDLPFWKRVKNFVTMWRNVYVTYRNVVSDQQKLAERYFDMPLPPLLEMQKNISLVFVNQADAMMPARPKLANVITFTSLHVSPNPQPLPQVCFTVHQLHRETFRYDVRFRFSMPVFVEDDQLYGTEIRETLLTPHKPYLHYGTTSLLIVRQRDW